VATDRAAPAVLAMLLWLPQLKYAERQPERIA